MIWIYSRGVGYLDKLSGLVWKKTTEKNKIMSIQWQGNIGQYLLKRCYFLSFETLEKLLTFS